ncbi:putative bifunctional diguanylate cyclase/phosphodiesterase [Novosphingobium huizhouense]|uniref:putative bifunctional diguanylate cyclase/phosphodiesterase n=1 Tax=Novosphingobium huizhouense TaxID=2866625 RepID=UPI001CD886B6|nr:EAL domain-containing protein [Novosphingobium huizhouense]
MTHLIRHEVDPADREWFDGCRLTQFQSLPLLPFEIVRALMLVLICAPRDPALMFLPAVWSIVALAMVEEIRRRKRAGQSASALMRFIAKAMIWRSFATSLLALVLVWSAPPERLSAVVLATVVIANIELFGQFTMPVEGLVSGLIATAGLALGLALRPDVDAGPVLAVLAVQALALHMKLFNLNYLYSTRRLRTRKLQTAHETIQLLLNQYDEHGSDWLVETDARGLIVNPSERLCRSTGLSAAELAGRKLVDLFVKGQELTALRSAAHRLKPFRDMSVTFRSDDGVRHWSISGCPMFTESGEHRGFRGFIRDVTQRRAAENRVRYLAHHDSLTGLANRGEFHARLEAMLARLKRDRSLALLLVDLDHFKTINDSMGHGIGDRVLIETARRLTEIGGPGSVAARLGGDGFAVILPRVTGGADARDKALGFVRGLSEPIAVEGRKVQVGASAGVAVAPADGCDSAHLMRAADLALYDAKANGRGSASLYHEGMQAELLERRNLEADLRVAFASGQFALHYQPLLRIENDAIAGFEALLRWNHPERGNVPPDVFIPIAEESGLIVQIGEWVLREAVAEAATWPDHLTVAVNVSAAQLRGGELLRQVVSALSTTGFDPRRLELEITETMLMEDSDEPLRLLHRLRALGVRIALDDFGTGYSSLNYLRSFPFDKIKIDRCFVTDIARNDESGAIVEAVLELAAKLNMQTIAEGVEDVAQLDSLRERGCEQVQGYLFSKALAANDLPIERTSPKQELPQPDIASISEGRRSLHAGATDAPRREGAAAR